MKLASFSAIATAAVALFPNSVAAWDLHDFEQGYMMTSFVKGRILCFGNSNTERNAHDWMSVAAIDCEKASELIYDAAKQRLYFTSTTGILNNGGTGADGVQALLRADDEKSELINGKQEMRKRVGFVLENSWGTGQAHLYPAEEMQWVVDGGRLKNVGSGQCVQVPDDDPEYGLIMKDCSDSPLQQVGTIDEPNIPKDSPTIMPTVSARPSASPSKIPTNTPTISAPPTDAPSSYPSVSNAPSSGAPSDSPSSEPTKAPTPRPTAPPTVYWDIPISSAASATVSSNVAWKNASDAGWARAGLSLSYDSPSCNVPIKDVGYVTIDLGSSQALDGVRVFMSPVNASYCNMYVSAWDENEPEPDKPECIGRTPAPTPKPTKAPVENEGIECEICNGGICGLIPGNDGPPQKCPGNKPYCMNTVVNADTGRKTYTKKCATYHDCQEKWWEESSDETKCTDFDSQTPYFFQFTCSYCCVKDGCNTKIFPDPDVLFQGKSRRLDIEANGVMPGQDTQVTELEHRGLQSNGHANVYSSFCSPDFGPVAGEDGIEFPIYPRRQVRYVRVWVGRNSIESTAHFIDIIPLTTEAPETFYDELPVGAGLGADGYGKAKGGNVDEFSATFVDETTTKRKSESVRIDEDELPTGKRKSESVRIDEDELPAGAAGASGQAGAAGASGQAGMMAAPLSAGAAGSSGQAGMMGAPLPAPPGEASLKRPMSTPATNNHERNKNKGELPGKKNMLTGQSHGDPHFQTWSGKKYDFHGGCDLVLLKNQGFANGLGLHVHIRTRIQTWWSHISHAVVGLGPDTLEVKGGDDGGSFWLNGELGEALEEGAKLSISGYPIVFHSVTAKQNRFRIDLGNGGALSIETYKNFVRVNVKVSNHVGFEEAVGMMGAYPSGAMVARDGVTEMEDANEFGMEWQVLASEPMLFHSLGEVHHPAMCAMPDKSTTRSQRRLGESAITEDDASLACAHAPEDEKDSCIFDVLATNDKDMAGSY